MNLEKKSFSDFSKFLGSAWGVLIRGYRRSMRSSRDLENDCLGISKSLKNEPSSIRMFQSWFLNFIPDSRFRCGPIFRQDPSHRQGLVLKFLNQVPKSPNLSSRIRKWKKSVSNPKKPRLINKTPAKIGYVARL